MIAAEVLEISLRRGERVVTGHISFLFLTIFEKRKVDDPPERVLAFFHEVVFLSEVEAEPPHDVVYLGPRIRHDENHVAVPSAAKARLCAEVSLFLQVFHDGRDELPAILAHPDEAARREVLRRIDGCCRGLSGKGTSP